jgi:beta-galactosidase
VYRSEREAKPEGAALVKLQSGKGQIYLTSINLQQLKSEGEALLRTMLTNIGLELKEMPLNTRRAFGYDGTSLERAILLNGKDVDESKLLSMDKRQFAATYESKDVEAVQTDMNGFFNFSRLRGIGREDSTVYLSFWIFSPRSLVDLLVEPDMPKLNITVEGRTGVNAYIDGTAITMNERRLENMPLKEGWNHFLLRLEKQAAREWRVKVQLNSDNQTFFKQVKSSVAMP